MLQMHASEDRKEGKKNANPKNKTEESIDGTAFEEFLECA
jgi:hypothetical protein